MFKRIGRLLTALGTRLTWAGVRMQVPPDSPTARRTQTDPDGTVTVAVVSGPSFMDRVFADVRPKPQFVVSLESLDADPVIAVFDTEPQARNFIQRLRLNPVVSEEYTTAAEERTGTRLDPGGYIVTRFSGGTADAEVYVLDGDPFNADEPLFPVHDSAA